MATPKTIKKRPTIKVGNRRIYSNGEIRLSERITQMIGWKPGQRISVFVDADRKQMILSE